MYFTTFVNTEELIRVSRMSKYFSMIKTFNINGQIN